MNQFNGIFHIHKNPQNISLKFDDEIQDAIYVFSETASEVATSSKRYNGNKNYRYSTTIQNLIKQKKNLRRKWQVSRSPTLKSQLSHPSQCSIEGQTVSS